MWSGAAGSAGYLRHISDCVVFGVDSGQEADLIIENQRGSQLQPNDAANSLMRDVPDHHIIATLSTIDVPTLIGAHPIAEGQGLKQRAIN
jgi:hypothetical protein